MAVNQPSMFEVSNVVESTLPEPKNLQGNIPSGRFILGRRGRDRPVIYRTSGACTLVRTPPTIRLPARFPMPVSIHPYRQFPITMLSLNTLTKMAKALKVTVAELVE